MSRRNVKLADVGKIPSNTYSADAQVQRKGDSGMSWTPKGAIGTEQKIGQSVPVLFYNSSGTVAFVAFGTTGLAVSTAANGMPVLPNSTAIYNSGPNEYMKASSASVFAYVADFDPLA